MNGSVSSTVYVVVDRNYGERLASLPSDDPVWVVDSPGNGAVARRLQPTRLDGHLHGITTFRTASGADAETDLIGVLDTVDLHHGKYSASPPYSRLTVVGCRPSEAVCAALAQLGFRVVGSGDQGFDAASEAA
jgi:hypothetical protein